MVEEYLLDLQTLEANVKELIQNEQLHQNEINIIHESV